MSFVLCLTAPAIAAESVGPVVFRPAYFPVQPLGLFGEAAELEIRTEIQEEIDEWINANADQADLFQKPKSFDGSVRVQNKLVGNAVWTEKKDTETKSEKAHDDHYIPFFQGSDPGVSFISSYDRKDGTNITMISNKGDNVWHLRKEIQSAIERIIQ